MSSRVRSGQLALFVESPFPRSFLQRLDVLENKMGLIEAARNLKQGDHILYQDVAQQYEFRSGVVEQISIDTHSPHLRLTCTDVRSLNDNPTFPLEYDPVFYKVPVELLEGKLGTAEIDALITTQNEVLLPDSLKFMGEMYQNEIAGQLEMIVDSYIPKGKMPHIELTDVAAPLRR